MKKLWRSITGETLLVIMFVLFAVAAMFVATKSVGWAVSVFVLGAFFSVFVSGAKDKKDGRFSIVFATGLEKLMQLSREGCEVSFFTDGGRDVYLIVSNDKVKVYYLSEKMSENIDEAWKEFGESNYV